MTSLEEAEHVLRSPFSHPAKRSFGIAVPSVIVPVWNIVFYPQRHGFWKHVSIETMQPFSYDPRLFPEDAEFDR